MGTARTRAISRTPRSLTVGRHGPLTAGRSRLLRTAVGTATRYLSWTRTAPTRAWSQIQKAVEQRHDGRLTAKRFILQTASRKITEQIVKSFRPQCESSEWDERHGRQSRD